MTDQELIDGTLRGEHAAFGLLVQRYQRLVESAAYGATGRHDLVDDVVQDTFVTAWRTIDRLRDAASLRSWLYGIARNLGHKARRSARRALPLDASTPSPAPVDPIVDTIVERERDREVATALARLPRRYREPLVLFYYEHCSVREVATALAMQESAAMQRLSRGRRKLGEALATRVETALETKPSRKAVVAAVLLLLPARSASAATLPVTAASTSTPPTRVAAWLATHRRPIGALLGGAVGIAVLVAAISRSNEVVAREAARDRPPQKTHQAAPPVPSLPPPGADREHDDPHDHRIVVTSAPYPTYDDPDHLYRVVSVTSSTPFETCARGARAVAMAAFGNDAIHEVNGERYFEPSAELMQTVNAAGERGGAACGGEQWPELYVICEGTVSDIHHGTINCYPFDVFRDS